MVAFTESSSKHKLLPAAFRPERPHPRVLSDFKGKSIPAVAFAKTDVWPNAGTDKYRARYRTAE